MKALCISGVASGVGKTLLTTALLSWFHSRVRPFKIGPDFIDPQFHTAICGVESINLDGFIMTPPQLQWLYAHYATYEVALCEGVMGFYDGHDKQSSAYDITTLLNIPTVLVIDGSGSYITVSAVIQGMLRYKESTTIRGVVFNKLGSQSHYERIKRYVEEDNPSLCVLGWIPKNLPSLSSVHLGLNLEEKEKIASLSDEVLRYIDKEQLLLLMNVDKPLKPPYPFPTMNPSQGKLAIVHDKRCFSCLYHDNLVFLREMFQEVVIIDASADEVIPSDCESVYLCGGYVETPQAYELLSHAQHFCHSLQYHSQTKKVYGECAGLLYLGKSVDDKMMSGILDVAFSLEKRFVRLGYYRNKQGIKGHCFHYTRPLNQGCEELIKDSYEQGEDGSFCVRGVWGTYLHTMFRCYPSLVHERLMAWE